MRFFSIRYSNQINTNIYHCILGNLSWYRDVLFLGYYLWSIIFSNICEVELTIPAGMNLYWTFFLWELYIYKKVLGLYFEIIKNIPIFPRNTMMLGITFTKTILLWNSKIRIKIFKRVVNPPALPISNTTCETQTLLICTDADIWQT